MIGRIRESAYGVVFASALEITRDYPLFGVGVRNYQAVCVEDRYGPPTMGPESYKRCLGHPHNVYLQWLAETGIVGLASISPSSSFRSGRLFRRRPPIGTT